MLIRAFFCLGIVAALMSVVAVGYVDGFPHRDMPARFATATVKAEPSSLSSSYIVAVAESDRMSPLANNVAAYFPVSDPTLADRPDEGAKTTAVTPSDLYVSQLPFENFLARTESGAQRWSSIAIQAADANGIPRDFFLRLLAQESGFRPTTVSKAGAQGIAQFMPATAAAVGLRDPFEPISAMYASAAHLAALVKQFGNIGLAAAAYNAGPERVNGWLSGRRSLPDETRNYVWRITGLEAESWTGKRIGANTIGPATVAYVRSDRINSQKPLRRSSAVNLCESINATGKVCRVQKTY
jgi:soluble lytic murein transglycosylase-like protein